MKYKQLYTVLEQHRLNTPGFQYDDRSGWRSYSQTYIDRLRPLWIIAEDPSTSRRYWITQEGPTMKITVGHMNKGGGNCGTIGSIRCATKTILAEKLQQLLCEKIVEKGYNI